MALHRLYTQMNFMKKLFFLGLMVISTISLCFAQRHRNPGEVFIQMEERGYFETYLDDELIGSSTGRFRFYEVYNTKPVLTITAGKRKIFSQAINVRPNKRLIFSFSTRNGIKLINELDLYRNNVYALNDFDDYAGAYNTGIVPPKTPTNGPSNSFNQLVITVKNTSFDDDKLKVINAYSTYNPLSTNEISTLLALFSKDDSKLLFAKKEYAYVTDPERYYLLKDAFSFLSTKDEFSKFLATQKDGNGFGRPMSPADFNTFRQGFEKESFDDRKIDFAKAALSNVRLSSAQVKTLIPSFSFDDKALTFAKWAFRNTWDKENYYTIADAFKFQSNKKELLDFIANPK